MIPYLLANPAFFVAIIFILGLLVGSFLNVVIHRLPIMLEKQWTEQCKLLLEESENNAPYTSGTQNKPTKKIFNLIWPGSHCPNCQHEIRAWENIPVVSYLFLRGKCANCKQKISIRYPLVELMSGLMAAGIAIQFGATAQTFLALLLVWSLISLTLIDFDHQLLPDNITLPLLWLGLIVNAFGQFVSLEEALWGAVGGYLSLWLVYWGFKLLTGKEGMGYGDFKLLAALGAWLGFQMLPLIILLSAFVGAVIGISMIVIKGRDKEIPIPFGPFLAAAGFIALLWGDTLVTSYLQFAGLQ
ncbi:MAG: A24 family peptidase [Pseudomonadales bacterium]|nr:A24 family peptidase [Pseudomonadales bacterium]